MTTDQQSTTERARQEADRLTRRARQEAGRAVDEVKHQGHELYGQARGRMRDEARHQTDRAVEGLHTISSDMRQMSEDRQTETPLASWMQQGADKLDDLAAHVSERGFDGLVEDVKGYARRNPGTFLAVSFGVGLLAGRLARNMEFDSTDDGVRRYPDRGQLRTGAPGAPGLSESGYGSTGPGATG